MNARVRGMIDHTLTVDSTGNGVYTTRFLVEAVSKEKAAKAEGLPTVGSPFMFPNGEDSHARRVVGDPEVLPASEMHNFWYVILVYSTKNPINQYIEVKPFPFPSDEQPPPGVMFVFRNEQGEPEVAEYLCPCGCSHTVWTPLVNSHRPRAGNRPIWDYSKGPIGPTLSPSVRWTSGCRAHFNITDGKVIIHGDSGK